MSHIQYIGNKPVAVVTIHGPVAALDNSKLSRCLWNQDGDTSGKEAMFDCDDDRTYSMV